MGRARKLKNQLRNQRQQISPVGPAVVVRQPEGIVEDEMQMDADREYFEKNPLADHYYRKPFDNEIQVMFSLEGKVPRQMKVMKTTLDGVRMKMPIF
jgi:hypothetical protein